MDFNKLKGKIPDEVIAKLPVIEEKFEANTPVRMAHFLAQCAHESGGFKLKVENLNYSAKGLLGTFRKYFPTEALRKQYERKPIMIASRAYADRIGNGPEATKDGYTYRGRGYIQTTGKSNYQAFTKFIGEDCVANPDLVATKYPLESAAFFFDNRKLWTICDKGANDATVTAVTKVVNNGINGLPERLKYFREYYAVLKTPVVV